MTILAPMSFYMEVPPGINSKQCHNSDRVAVHFNNLSLMRICDNLILYRRDSWHKPSHN